VRLQGLQIAFETPGPCRDTRATDVRHMPAAYIEQVLGGEPAESQIVDPYKMRLNGGVSAVQ